MQPFPLSTQYVDQMNAHGPSCRNETHCQSNDEQQRRDDHEGEGGVRCHLEQPALPSVASFLEKSGDGPGAPVEFSVGQGF